jgi:peptide/nickel transport system permease protein
MTAILPRLARRLATAAATLLLVTLGVFLLVRAAPGSPLDAGEETGLHRATPQAREALRSIYRLDLPVHRQYALWLRDLMRGDLGRSFHDRRPVIEKIGERIGLTLLVDGLALGLMLGVSVPLGLLCALRPGSAWDRLAAGATNVLHAVPAFWAGLLLQIAFAVRLGWLPLAGVETPGQSQPGGVGAWPDRAAHLLLPVLCLSYGGLAFLSRFVRATLLDSATVESWRGARARGLSRVAVIWRHGFRQAGLPLLTLAGFLLPGLFAGSVVVETVFALPGLGGLFVDAAFQRDIPVLMGLTLLSGAATLVGVVVADLGYLVAEPRARRA